MNQVLIAYTTMSGSTVEVASAVGQEIGRAGLQVDVLPLEEVGALDAYDAVVLGAPMAMGWHRSALNFLVENREAWSRIPLAVFVMALSLTSSNGKEIQGVPIYVDEKLARAVKSPGRPSFKERYTAIDHYATPIIAAAGPGRLVSLAFFGGCLDYGRLNGFARLFVKWIVQAQPGDRRDWQAIQAWAGGLTESLGVH